MKKKNYFKFLSIFLEFFLLSQVDARDEHHPQQVHLSLGVNSSEMVVTWVTMASTGVPIVEYGVDDLDRQATGYETEFIDDGDQKVKRYIARVTLKDLEPETAYKYHCGGHLGWSSIFLFTTFPNHNNFVPSIAIYGDLGFANGQSIPRLKNYVHKRKIHAIIHNGDLAYNLDNDQGYVGDRFMRQIEGIAAFVPYQTVVGNHESAYNFSHYKNRFTMINSGNKFSLGEQNNLFYSFNLGQVHFVVLSTEFYFYIEYGFQPILNQFNWLNKDLEEANRNRDQQPWIVTLGHRPMYCSNNDTDDCTKYSSIVRKGLPYKNVNLGLEDLFYTYGVDIEIWAHEHSYERLLPIYDTKIYPGSKDEPYKNPKAPVHLISGSAGCQERVDPFVKNPPEWSAKRISDYGFSLYQFYNSTHVHIQQISDDKAGLIMDDFWIIKDYHGPYTESNELY